MESKNWFDVDKNGLAELQAGKPKIYAIRELIANAWDEQITNCKVDFSFSNGIATISVEDDCPEGFADLRDSFTLFKHTNKRADPNKRGRYNLGEKQSISICQSAIIETTKGTVIFDASGRSIKNTKRLKGSKLILKLKMTKAEFDDLSEVKNYFVPEGINFIVNDEKIEYKKPYKIIEATLLTELDDNGAFRKTQRKTKIFLHKSAGKSRIFELGIPVQVINCQFDIDVKQKIPLGIDRENVLPSFLKDIFAEVLNCTFEDITEDNSSDLWVRTAITDERIHNSAVKDIIKKRYGDKACIASPFDKRSMDEAISKGYNLIFGAEMSKEEWAAVKSNEVLETSSKLFGVSFVGATVIDTLTDEQLKVKDLSKKIAKRLLGIDLNVYFVKSAAGVGAEFNFDSNTLTFNMSKLGKDFFTPPISAKVFDIILHELGHFGGRQHTQSCYHELLTKMAGELIMIACQEPLFFKEGL